MGRTSDAKERLIQSGMELLQAGGYAQAGVQEICERAGVRKGSFYHFFPTKSHLGLAVVERFQRYASEVLDQALATDLPPPERIERLFLMVARIQERFHAEEGVVKGCPFGNLALEMSTRDEGLRLALARIIRETIARLEAAIQPDMPPDASGRPVVRERAETLFALLEGALLIAKAENDPAIIRRMAPVARRMV